MSHLTLHSILTRLNDLGNTTTDWKTLWEKEKMPVTSIFSFFHNVFYPSAKTDFNLTLYLC